MCPNALRRIAIGFGGGLFFSFAPLLVLGVLITLGTVEWPPQSDSLMLVLPILAGWLIAMPFFVSAFSFVLLFRCPECRRRINRLTRVPLESETGMALRYYCSVCDIEWDVAWQERAGDAD